MPPGGLAQAAERVGGGGQAGVGPVAGLGLAQFGGQGPVVREPLEGVGQQGPVVVGEAVGPRGVAPDLVPAGGGGVGQVGRLPVVDPVGVVRQGLVDHRQHVVRVAVGQLGLDQQLAVGGGVGVPAAGVGQDHAGVGQLALADLAVDQPPHDVGVVAPDVQGAAVRLGGRLEVAGRLLGRPEGRPAGGHRRLAAGQPAGDVQGGRRVPAGHRQSESEQVPAGVVRVGRRQLGQQRPGPVERPGGQVAPEQVDQDLAVVRLVAAGPLQGLHLLGRLPPRLRQAVLGQVPRERVLDGGDLSLSLVLEGPLGRAVDAVLDQLQPAAGLGVQVHRLLQDGVGPAGGPVGGVQLGQPQAGRRLAGAVPEHVLVQPLGVGPVARPQGPLDLVQPLGDRLLGQAVVDGRGPLGVGVGPQGGDLQVERAGVVGVPLDEPRHLLPAVLVVLVLQVQLGEQLVGLGQVRPGRVGHDPFEQLDRLGRLLGPDVGVGLPGEQVEVGRQAGRLLPLGRGRQVGDGVPERRRHQRQPAASLEQGVLVGRPGTGRDAVQLGRRPLGQVGPGGMGGLGLDQVGEQAGPRQPAAGQQALDGRPRQRVHARRGRRGHGLEQAQGLGPAGRVPLEQGRVVQADVAVLEQPLHVRPRRHARRRGRRRPPQQGLVRRLGRRRVGQRQEVGPLQAVPRVVGPVGRRDLGLGVLQGVPPLLLVLGHGVRRAVDQLQEGHDLVLAVVQLGVVWPGGQRRVEHAHGLGHQGLGVGGGLARGVVAGRGAGGRRLRQPHGPADLGPGDPVRQVGVLGVVPQHARQLGHGPVDPLGRRRLTAHGQRLLGRRQRHRQVRQPQADRQDRDVRPGLHVAGIDLEQLQGGVPGVGELLRDQVPQLLLLGLRGRGGPEHVSLEQPRPRLLQRRLELGRPGPLGDGRLEVLGALLPHLVVDPRQPQVQLGVGRAEGRGGGELLGRERQVPLPEVHVPVRRQLGRVLRPELPPRQRPPAAASDHATDQDQRPLVESTSCHGVRGARRDDQRPAGLRSTAAQSG